MFMYLFFVIYRGNCDRFLRDGWIWRYVVGLGASLDLRELRVYSGGERIYQDGTTEEFVFSQMILYSTEKKLSSFVWMTTSNDYEESTGSFFHYCAYSRHADEYVHPEKGIFLSYQNQGLCSKSLSVF